MKKEFSPSRLDVRGFAEAGGALAGGDVLAVFPRLAGEAVEAGEGVAVQWQVAGEARSASGAGEVQPWLHLTARVELPLTCQRCLAPVPTVLAVERSFRFVADEATAAAEDEEAQEDVLAISRDFNLMELIEDELLMAIPVTPSHEVCPQPLPLSAADPDFDQAQQEDRAQPFAALAALRVKKP